MKAYTTVSTRKTSQSESVIGKSQVKNNAGGYVFAIDDWQRLERFLILGSEGGTYYVKEQKLTRDNAGVVERCIKADGKRTVTAIVDVSHKGRAVKNDPALFALAMCAGLGDAETRKFALHALPKVARIGTHLFHFAQYVEQFRGWGRGLKKAVAQWYNDKLVDKLVYDLVKYQSRDGWAHRDMLRLSHPKTDDAARNNAYAWAVGKDCEHSLYIEGYEKAKAAEKPDVNLITDYGLTREMIPTDWLNSPEIWEALLEKMPVTAMIRNLGKMTNVGLLKPLSESVNAIVGKVTDIDVLKKGRVHPLSVLVAMRTYAQGAGMRGSLTWEPVTDIVNALDDAFYLAFGAVETTGKRHMLALDVSGSMGWASIAGMPVTPREASAAMAMVTERAEKKTFVTVFSHGIQSHPLSSRQRLDDVFKSISHLNFGATDCALPMLYAAENNISVDVFVIYTDNETWYGDIHPFQALDRYRQKTGIPSKLVVVGMTSTGFSIAEPDDAGCMDVVGFDTATPNVMSQFISQY